MSFTFQKLDAYQKANEFAKDILTIVSKTQPNNYALSDQMRRAAISIPANIAEGWGRWHPREKNQFFRIALGSLNESVALLELAASRSMVDAANYERLNDLLLNVSRLIGGLLRANAQRRM